MNTPRRSPLPGSARSPAARGARPQRRDDRRAPDSAPHRRPRRLGLGGRDRPPRSPPPPAITSTGHRRHRAARRRSHLLTHDAFALSDCVIAGVRAADAADRRRCCKSGDAGADGQPGDPLEGPPAGRRAVRRRQHVPVASAGRRHLRAVPARRRSASVPSAFQLDPQHRVTPVDYGDVCLNVDHAAFAAGESRPRRRSCRTSPSPPTRGMLVVENPATSSPGLAFMLATIARFGETGSYTLARLLARPARRTTCRSAPAGTTPTTRSSPAAPATVTARSSSRTHRARRPRSYFASSPPPTASDHGDPRRLLPARSSSRASSPARRTRPARGRSSTSCVSQPAQQDIPLQMFVFPAVPGTPLPDVFTQCAQIAARAR